MSFPTGEGTSSVKSKSVFFLIVVLSSRAMLFCVKNVWSLSQKSPVGSEVGFGVSVS